MRSVNEEYTKKVIFYNPVKALDPEFAVELCKRTCTLYIAPLLTDYNPGSFSKQIKRSDGFEELSARLWKKLIKVKRK